MENEWQKAVVEWISKIETKVITLNERTKRQTLQIRELRNEIKKIKRKYKNEI